MPRGEMSRPSARGSGDRKVNYYEDDDDSVDDEKEEEDAFIIDDDDDAVVVLDDSEDDIDRRMSNKKVLSSASKTKGVVAACQSISLPPGRMTVQDHDAKKYGQKMAAVPAASRSRGNVNSPRKRKTQSIDSANDQGSNDDEGMDIVIPHSLLDKSRGSGKNECMVLVQVADEPASYGTTSTKTSQQQQKQQHRPLDFHGQSGAIGRFEADGDGVILDLKGYQYRGTIRPGPTAMVVALTRDGKLKVESITDEFVTLDAETRTDVMAKLDAVVENGSMDETYRYDGEEDVNRRTRENYGNHDDEDDDESNHRDNNDGSSTKGKKKRARSAGAVNTSAKKRKISTTKMKKKK